MLKSESPKFQRITFVGLGDKRQGEILFTTDNEDVVIGDRQLQAKLDTRSCLHVTARDSHDTLPRRIKSKGPTFKQKWKIFENEKARSGVEKYFVGKLTSMKQDQKQATDPWSYTWCDADWIVLDLVLSLFVFPSVLTLLDNADKHWQTKWEWLQQIIFHFFLNFCSRIEQWVNTNIST